MPRPKKIETSLAEARQEGFDRGVTSGALAERKMIDQEAQQQERRMKEKERQANIDALNAVARLAQTFSQSIESICRSMYNGRGM